MEKSGSGVYDEYLETCARLGLEFIRQSRHGSQSKSAVDLPTEESRPVKASARISPFFAKNASIRSDRSFSLIAKKHSHQLDESAQNPTIKPRIELRRDNPFNDTARSVIDGEEGKEASQELAHAVEEKPKENKNTQTWFYQFDETKGLKKLLALFIIIVLAVNQYLRMFSASDGISKSSSQNTADSTHTSHTGDLFRALDGAKIRDGDFGVQTGGIDHNSGSQHAKRILQALDEGKPPGE